MAEQANLRLTHLEKNLGAMKAERTAKRITFERTKANAGKSRCSSIVKTWLLLRALWPCFLGFQFL